MPKSFKYLIDPENNVSHVKVDENFTPPSGWTVSATKPDIILTVELIKSQRDMLMKRSPLMTPFGNIDYDDLSREKLAVAAKSMVALDNLYPNEAPHSVDWTMYDNSIQSLNLLNFQMIDLYAAQRGIIYHEAAKRVKTAISSNTQPLVTDLQTLELL